MSIDSGWGSLAKAVDRELVPDYVHDRRQRIYSDYRDKFGITRDKQRQFRIITFMSTRAKRTIWIVIALMVAHVAGSYACMLFTMARIEQVTSTTIPRRVVYVRKLIRYGAPVYLPQMIVDWRKMQLESGKGLALIALAYLIPTAGVFTLMMILPKLVQDDGDNARKERGYAAPAPPATPPASAAPAANTATARSAPPAVTPPPASRVQPLPASKVQPPPPSRAVTPPPPARTTPPPPRMPTPPPPARTTPPPPRRPS